MLFDILRPAWLLLIAALAVAAPGVALPAATGPATPVAVARDGVWAQTYVDRAADPAVRFGRLPNGLRYAVRHNATPLREVSMRLLIGTGALAERDDQQGLAHFVEHMAFRGSRHVPDGELIRSLERHGLSNGADTNAFTTQESTFFQFDLPANDAETVATGLNFLRETASEVSFAATAVDAERAVILAEERVRDGPAVRAQRAALGFVLAGQRAADRWPIGVNAIVAHATPAQLREFYAAHYRPDNATIVVVGDIDPEAMVAAITAKFGDWTAAGSAAAVDPGRPAARGAAAAVFTGPGVSHEIEVAWVRPFDAAADTVAHRREVLLGFIATQVFNQRLQDIALAAKPPFFAARMERSNVLASANVTALDFHGDFAHWPGALAAVIGEQRRLLRDGVTAPEVDRVVVQLTAALTTSRAGAATRATPALANGLLGASLHNTVYADPAQELAEFTAMLPSIDAAAVDAAFHQAFDGSGPLLFLSAAGAVPDGEAQLLAALAAAEAAPIAATTAAAAPVWPYGDFGPPGRVVSRRTIAGVGVTSVTFANGSTLLVKPTRFATDGVEVDVHLGFGRAGLPPERAAAFWTASGTMPVFVNGGTGKLSTTEIQRVLAGRVVGLDLATGDAAFDLRGHTRPDDLTQQLQLMTAYLVDPGFRAESFDRLKAAMASSLLQLDSDPNLVLLRTLPRRLHDGDARWTTIPDGDQVEATTLGDARAVLEAALGVGRLDVVVVGDVDVDRVVAAVAATLGTLPPRSGPPAPPRDGVRFPAPTAEPVAVFHRGRADQATAVAAWHATDFYANPADVRALVVTMAILRSRLIDRLRGADGLTYSPDVEGSFSDDFDGYGSVVAQIELTPDRLDEFFAKLDAIVADLGRHEPTPDELERAKVPVIEERVHSLENNAYWVLALARATRDRREFATIVERVSAVRAVTAADVRRVALRYLQPAATVRLVVRPSVPIVRPFRTAPRPVPLCSNKFIRACAPS